MKIVKYPGLVAEMARHGDNQTTIAKMFDITASSICKRFSGELEWKISEIEKICDYYGKNYDELFKSK